MFNIQLLMLRCSVNSWSCVQYLHSPVRLFALWRAVRLHYVLFCVCWWRLSFSREKNCTEAPRQPPSTKGNVCFLLHVSEQRSVCHLPQHTVGFLDSWTYRQCAEDTLPLFVNTMWAVWECAPRAKNGLTPTRHCCFYSCCTLSIKTCFAFL